MIGPALHPPAGVLAFPDLPSWLVGFVILVAVLALGGLHVWLNWEVGRELYGGGGTDPGAMANCPDCGARTTTDPPECDYCGASLGRT